MPLNPTVAPVGAAEGHQDQLVHVDDAFGYTTVGTAMGDRTEPLKFRTSLITNSDNFDELAFEFIDLFGVAMRRWENRYLHP